MFQHSNKLAKMVVVVYWLYLVAIVVQIISIVGVVISYMSRESVKHTYLQSHIEYQIRTFWVGLLYFFISTLLTIIFIGYFLIILTFLWYIVRNVKGLIAINKEQPILNSKTWFI